MKLNLYKYRIAYDVDGVLLNFWKAASKEAGFPSVRFVSSWMISKKWFSDVWNKIKKDKDFWSTLPILNFPSDISTHVTMYITAMPKLMEKARIYNLFVYHSFPRAPVVVSYDKLAAVIENDIDFIIDDKEATVRLINDAYDRGETKCRALKYCPYYLDEEPTIWDLHDLSKVGEKLQELKWI
jgi:hypothetical protein